MLPARSTSSGDPTLASGLHGSSSSSSTSASAFRTRGMGLGGRSNPSFADLECRSQDTTRNAIRSEYDHSFSRTGETEGSTMRCLAHQYTVVLGTPDSAAARAAS